MLDTGLFWSYYVFRKGQGKPKDTKGDKKMFYVMYNGYLFEEMVGSYEEACELVCNRYGFYDGEEVFLLEPDEVE